MCCSDNTITIRAHDERQVFTESGGLGGGAPFCLANAPVLFHLQVVIYSVSDINEEDYGNQKDEDEDSKDEKKDDHNFC